MHMCVCGESGGGVKLKRKLFRVFFIFSVVVVGGGTEALEMKNWGEIDMTRQAEMPAPNRKGLWAQSQVVGKLR